MTTKPQTQTGSHSNNPEPASPYEMACAVDDSIQLPHNGEQIHISGIYVDKKKQSRNGFCYDGLRDPALGRTITVYIHERIKARMRDGRPYTLRGYLTHRVAGIGDLNIELIFNVSGVENVDLPSFEELLLKRSDIFHAKSTRGFKSVENVILECLRSDKLASIALIHGTDAIVSADVKGSLEELSASYQIIWRQVSLTNKSAIIETLRELDVGSAAVIGIIRGGGDLQTFNDLELALAASELNKPFITALGHAADLTLCDQIADKQFRTPTALGNFLEKMAQKAHEEESRQRELEVVENRLRATLADLRNRETQLAQQSAVVNHSLAAQRQEHQQQLADQEKRHRVQLNTEAEPHQIEMLKPVWGRYAVVAGIIGMITGVLITIAAMWYMERTNSASESGVPSPSPQQELQPTPVQEPTPPPINRRRRRG